jgi:hypothetical protein
MTDVCSRLLHLSDSRLLDFFNDSFPQRLPWKLSQFRKPMHSALTWALSTSISRLELPHTVPRQWRTIGPLGMCYAWNIMLTHISELGRTPSSRSKSLRNDTTMGDWLPARKPCEFALWRTRSAQWHMCTPDWGPRIHAKTPMEEYFPTSSIRYGHTRSRTRLCYESHLFPY